MLLEEKVKIPEVCKLSIFAYIKIENWQMMESVLLPQILTVIVT